MKAYFIHTRPQSYLVTFFAVITGYALSPEKPGDPFDILTDLCLLFVIFSILLWGGTNAFNTGQDGNEGPLTLLPDPPPVPKHLSLFGISLMLFAVILAYTVSLRLTVWTSIGLALSVFYSYKNKFFRRGKDIVVVDMLINTIGFGFCSILFGYMLTPAPITTELLFTGAGFTFAYLGGMPTSQIFQLNGVTDTTKNYTTLLGVRGVLRAGAFFFLCHILFLALAYTDIGFLMSAPVALTCWLGWCILVALSAIHSYWWSFSPFTEPYKRMNRQMLLMMGSQVLWTIYAWIKN